MSDTLPPETIAWSFIDHHQAPSHWHGALMDLIIRARKDGSAAAPCTREPTDRELEERVARAICKADAGPGESIFKHMREYWTRVAKAAIAAMPPHSAASTVEPVAKLDPVTDWVGARLRSASEKALAAAAAPITSTEPDAVREALANFLAIAWKVRVSYHDGVRSAERDLTDVEISLIFAALSRPAHGGWEITGEMVERAAKAMIANDSGTEGSALFDIHWREFGRGYKNNARIALTAALARNDRGGPAK